MCRLLESLLVTGSKALVAGDWYSPKVMLQGVETGKGIGWCHWTWGHAM
jgi:hypothetical protein